MAECYIIGHVLSGTVIHTERYASGRNWWNFSKRIQTGSDCTCEIGLVFGKIFFSIFFSWTTTHLISLKLFWFTAEHWSVHESDTRMRQLQCKRPARSSQHFVSLDAQDVIEPSVSWKWCNCSCRFSCRRSLWRAGSMEALLKIQGALAPRGWSTRSFYLHSSVQPNMKQYSLCFV